MRNDFISPEQLTQITLKYYTTNFNLEATAQAFQEIRNTEQVIDTIKKAVKDNLCDIEGELWKAQKIQKLNFYDKVCMNKQMYHEFLNVHNILRPENIQDFFCHFKYKRTNPHWYRLPKKVDMPIQILNSNKKMNIYQDFLKYFEEKDLFKEDLEYEQMAPDDKRQQFVIGSFPTKFNETQICKTFRLYELHSGDIERVKVKLKQQGVSGQKCQPQKIQGLLIDCMVTGLCRVYRSTSNQQEYYGISWQKFRKIKKPIIANNCPIDLKITLARIGIYDNASKYEMKIICEAMGVKPKGIKIDEGKRKSKISNSVKLKEQNRKSVLDRIKKQMKDILAQQNYKKTS